MSETCPTCGPTATEQHPRHPVTRCANCKEWLAAACWMTTWPTAGIPTYAQHATEQQAAAHAHQLVASGTATVATYFEMGTP